MLSSCPPDVVVASRCGASGRARPVRWRLRLHRSVVESTTVRLKPDPTNNNQSCRNPVPSQRCRSVRPDVVVVSTRCCRRVPMRRVWTCSVGPVAPSPASKRGRSTTVRLKPDPTNDNQSCCQSVPSHAQCRQSYVVVSTRCCRRVPMRRVWTCSVGPVAPSPASKRGRSTTVRLKPDPTNDNQSCCSQCRRSGVVASGPMLS